MFFHNVKLESSSTMTFLRKENVPTIAAGISSRAGSLPLAACVNRVLAAQATDTHSRGLRFPSDEICNASAPLARRAFARD